MNFAQNLREVLWSAAGIPVCGRIVAFKLAFFQTLYKIL
jgi:hypothetical protein